MIFYFSVAIDNYIVSIVKLVRSGIQMDQLLLSVILLNYLFQILKTMGTCCASKDVRSQYTQRNDEQTLINPSKKAKGVGSNNQPATYDISLTQKRQRMSMNSQEDEVEQIPLAVQNLTALIFDKVKTISSDFSKDAYKEYQIKGFKQELEGIASAISKYRYCFFAYLMPIKDINLQQLSFGEIKLIIPNYPRSLADLKMKLKKYDKNILIFRITRGINYLLKKGITTHSLKSDNIFFTDDDIQLIPKLGLPSYSQRKFYQDPATINRQDKKKIILDLLQLFLSIFTEREIQKEQMLEAIHFIQDENLKNLFFDMYEQKNFITMQELMRRIFELNYFEEEPLQIQQSQKTTIEYESGQKYEGQVKEGNIKHGKGIDVDNLGNRYQGDWVDNQRSGTGVYFMPKEKYFYIGQWKNDKMHGRGFQLNFKRRNYYQGHFVDGKKQGRGLLQILNGQIYDGYWINDKKQGKGIYYDANDEWTYKGDWVNDNKNGQAEQLYANGAYFKGLLQNGVKNGYGYYYIPDQFSYQGYFKNNQYHGEGQYHDLKEKSTYIGFYRYNNFHGKGMYKKQGYSYDGQWMDGVRQGYGEQKIGISVTYKGDFKNNMRHGKGNLLEDGQFFQGIFVKGKFSGQGTYKYENGDSYSGSFVDKKKQGFGIYNYSEDGSKYEGQWKKDKRNGKGKLYFKNGGFYEGNWFNDKRHGQGRQFLSENNHYEGTWKDNVRDGFGIQVEMSGNKYEGNFKNNQKNGKGKILFKNGDIYEGQFVDNLHQGYGVYTFKNQDRYEGQWFKGSRQGKGKLLKSTGEYYEGEWKDNKKNGFGKEVYKNKLQQFEGYFKDDFKQGKGTLYNKKYGRLQCTWIKNKRQGRGVFYFYDEDETVEVRQYKNNIEINLLVTTEHEIPSPEPQKKKKKKK